MADGKIIIDTDLNTKGIESGLKGIEEKVNNIGDGGGLGKLGDIFDILTSKSKVFGKTFDVASKLIGSSAAMAVSGVVALGAAFAKLYELSKQNFFNNLQNIGKALEPAINAVKSLGQEFMTTFSNITGFQFSFSSLITEAIQFESSMASVAAIMGATGDGIDQITQTARQFGAETRYSAIQISESFSYMGMAGFSAGESIAAMGDMLNLTTLGATSLGIASDIVTDGLTSLGMTAEQTGNFVDRMAATITNSNTNVEMMGETLKYAGSIAGTLGVDMADLSVAIGLMADNGIKASNSGTALRTLMTNLSAPTNEVSKAIAQYGIEVAYASDGSLDLNQTLVNLRGTLKNLPLKEQAEAAKALAGKTGMGGLLAIINATDERYVELTDSINNATESVSYWNENCALTGKTGKDATDAIEMMKEAYKGAETSAAGLNLTTQDLALAVQILGADANVTSSNVEDLLSVFSALRTPTEANAKTMKELGLTYRELNDESFDYNKTIASIDSSIIGLTQAQKKQIKAQLNQDMTLEEANAVLKKYDLTARSASTGQIDLITNLEQLRDVFGGMDENTRKAKLEQMGLGSAIEEVNELVAMSDEEFKLYCKNIELATGLAEKMARAMDETTKGSLLSLASAMTDVGLEAFEIFKVSLNDVSQSLTRFFETWRDGDGDTFNYSFDSFNRALDGLLEDISNADIAGALSTAINNAMTFINGGSLAGILNIGTEIITQICKGIIDNKGKIEEGISSIINQIANWVSANAEQVGEAGKVILDAISNGIMNNKDSIRDALEAVTAVMDTWVVSSASIESLCGNFADIFIESFASQMLQKSTLKMGEIGNGIVTSLFNALIMAPGEIGMNAWEGLKSWLFPEAHADEVTEEGKLIGSKIAEGTVIGVDENGKFIYDTSNNAGKEAGKGITDGASESMSELTPAIAQELQAAAVAMQQEATNMYNGARVSFSKLNDVARESFVGMSNIINNQMLNATNTFRSGMLSMTNVATNQASNVRNAITTQFISINAVVRTQIGEARNTFTSQMLSMSAVGRTQASAVRNTITTQFISINNVVRTQITAARNVFTSQMMSMAAVARTQSSAIVSTFRSCASQMHSIGVQMGSSLRNGLASQSASIIATANSIAKGISAAMNNARAAASSVSFGGAGRSTFAFDGPSGDGQYDKLASSMDSGAGDIVARMKFAVESSQSGVSRGFVSKVRPSSFNSSSGNSSGEKIDKLINALENHKSVVITNIDGRVVAETTAPYMSDEIDNISYRKSRRRGED